MKQPAYTLTTPTGRTVRVYGVNWQASAAKLLSAASRSKPAKPERKPVLNISSVSQ
jgi:hypothetical protein